MGRPIGPRGACAGGVANALPNAGPAQTLWVCIERPRRPPRPWFPPAAEASCAPCAADAAAEHVCSEEAPGRLCSADTASFESTAASAAVVAAVIAMGLSRGPRPTAPQGAMPFVRHWRGRGRRRRRSVRWSKGTGNAAPRKIGEAAYKESVHVTDMLAKSFLNHFNNAFLNTIEQVRTPHLLVVVQSLRDFAAKVPPKYRGSIEKALKTEGFLSFLLARASLSLLCAKATMYRGPAEPSPSVTKEHEDIATVVEELYIAAMLHAEEQWERELKADGKTFMAVATSFVKHLADPKPLQQENVQAALLGFDANPFIWTQYGLDLLGISFDLSMESVLGMKNHSSSPSNGHTREDLVQAALVDNRKLSVLGGDSLYATAQWAMANVDSRACRKLITETIASYSDGQLRKRELLWNFDLTIREYLDIEKVAGVAAFFGASSACAALVNDVDDDVAEQIAEFGSDIGLVVGLLKDTRYVGICSALKLGRMSAPIIFTLEKDPRLRELLERRLRQEGDFEEAAQRVKEGGVRDTMRLVNRLGFRAAARLECLEDSKEREALMTLTRGIACLPLPEGCLLEEMESSNPSSSSTGRDHAAVVPEAADVLPDFARRSSHDCSFAQFSKRFDLKVENLRLRAQLARLRQAERRSRARLQAIREVAGGATEPPRRRPPLVGLGLQFDTQEIEWLLLRGLERRAPLPERLDLGTLLSCIARDQAEVQRRLMDLSAAAESHKLKRAVSEVFSGGGKRLRPALCLLVHQMLGSASAGALFNPLQTHQPPLASDKVLTLACSIETIHAASLVHDDILDDADTRRNQGTMHRILGPDVAVLSGDFLFAHASGLVESLENDEVTRLVSLVIEQFGHGEMSQSAKRFDTGITLFDYLTKSFYKTASLLAAACRASAVLTGPSCEVCDVLYSYGFYLGIAFQIADDVLDFTGTGEELGKPACQDLREGNLTAPVILCLNGNEDLGMAPAPCAAELSWLISNRFSREGDLERAVELIHEGGGIDMANRLADKMADKALEALMLVAPVDSEARRALAGLTKWAVRRKS